MQITQAQFDSSPLLIQQGALYLWGEYINAYRTPNAYQAVYKLGAFYVAVTHEQGQWAIASFTDPHSLRPYLHYPPVNEFSFEATKPHPRPRKLGC